MSMKDLTIIQYVTVLLPYLSMTIFLPAAIFHSKIKSERLAVRLMIYNTIGNCFMMTAVFMLGIFYLIVKKFYPAIDDASTPAQTMGILSANRTILLLLTLLPAVYLLIRMRRLPVLSWAKQFFQDAKLMAKRTLGVKTFIWDKLYKVFSGVRRFLLHLLKLMFMSPLDTVLTAGIIVLIVWMYGSKMVTVFGYTTSDMVVHTYWVNALSANQLFVNGVYPFGFHCVADYLHTVFGVDTYVFFRVFCMTQAIYIHLALLLFLKCCCKSKFVPYAGVGVYLTASFLYHYTYDRFYSTLPQEYGMMFILPSVYFLLAFLKKRKQELDADDWKIAKLPKKEKGKKEKEEKSTWHHRLRLGIVYRAGRIWTWYQSREHRASFWYLVWFALNFSLTLAVHFYDTMVAGLFYAAVAAGFFLRWVRTHAWGAWLKPIMTAVLAGLGLAILPMLVAFLLGTPLQGSLGWGMGVIQGSSETGAAASTPAPPTTAAPSPADHTGEAENEAGPSGGNVKAPTGTQRLIGQIKGKVSDLMDVPMHNVEIQKLEFALQYYVIPQAPKIFLDMTLYAILLLMLLGAVFLLLKPKERDYGAMLLSAGFFMALMVLMQAAAIIGLPVLLDANRCRIYLAYALPILGCFLADGALRLLLDHFKKRTWPLHLASLLFVGGMALLMTKTHHIREPYTPNILETNGAITSLSNIIRDEPDGTWTVCSAYDEMRMVQEHSYHYEILTFLGGMEGKLAQANVTIPTEKVFFFIEKVPVSYDYSLGYAEGAEVSKKSAAEPMPSTTSFTSYATGDRLIVMSKMYYWAQAFQKLFPGDISVYLEDDTFVCYVVEQNVNRLYNFAIDYGFNGNAKPSTEK